MLVCLCVRVFEFVASGERQEGHMHEGTSSPSTAAAVGVMCVQDWAGNQAYGLELEMPCCVCVCVFGCVCVCVCVCVCLSVCVCVCVK